MNNLTNINYTLTDFEIGGPAYFLRHLHETLPYTLLNVAGFIIGSTGNILIIGAICLTKELQNETNVFIFNLSLADLCITGFVNLFTVIGIFVGKSYFSKMHGLCSFISALCLIACVTSLINIGFLAINRYFIICHNNLYKKIFTFKKSILFCIINWIIGILVDLPNLTGWGGHYYDSKTLSCIWNRLKSHSYSIFFPTSSIVIPCICILFCYVRIFIYAKSSSQKALKIDIYKTNSKKNFQKSLRIAKGLFGSFLLFTICWLPYGVIVMIDFEDRLARTAHMFPIAIAHFNSTLNPIFYAISNSKFKKGYRKFANLILFKIGISGTNPNTLITEQSTFKQRTKQSAN